MGYGFLNNGDSQIWMSVFLVYFLTKGILLIVRGRCHDTKSVVLRPVAPASPGNS